MTVRLPILGNARVNPDWAALTLFKREAWKRLPFGEFAESVNERASRRSGGRDLCGAGAS